MVQEVIRPSEGSTLYKFIESTVHFLKNQKKERLQKKDKKVVKVHLNELGQRLYFVDCSSVGNSHEVPFKTLIDTGAANSLLHISVVNKLGLQFKPVKLVLATATGLDRDAIKGILHLKFAMLTTNNKVIQCCTDFIVTTKLNGLQSILGAEFLMDNDYVEGISKNCLVLGNKDVNIDFILIWLSK